MKQNSIQKGVTQFIVNTNNIGCLLRALSCIVALTPKQDTQREPARASREEREGTVRTKKVYHVAR